MPCCRPLRRAAARWGRASAASEGWPAAEACGWGGGAKRALFFLSILAVNLAVNKNAIIEGLWKDTGSATPFMHWYYPFNKGYSQEWQIPPYDLKRAKELLTEAGAANGFEITVNPTVFTYALDGPDVMEAVALDWEKLGIKVKRAPEDFGNFLPKVRARKTGPTSWVYASPPFEEPVLAWQRAIWSKGAFSLVLVNAPLRAAREQLRVRDASLAVGRGRPRSWWAGCGSGVGLTWTTLRSVRVASTKMKMAVRLWVTITKRRWSNLSAPPPKRFRQIAGTPLASPTYPRGRGESVSW